MSTVQAVPIVVSVLALLVSAVSAWSSLRQGRFVRGTRLGELVERISRESADFDARVADEDQALTEGIEELYLHRQEILALQASRLVRRRTRLSSREYLVIAGALDLVGDVDRARTLFARARRQALTEGPVYVAHALEEVAMSDFRNGRPEHGAAHFVRALEALPSPSGDAAKQRRARLLGSEAVFRTRHHADADRSEGLLDDADRLVASIVEDEVRLEMIDELADYRAQVSGEEPVVPEETAEEKPVSARPARRRLRPPR